MLSCSWFRLTSRQQLALARGILALLCEDFAEHRVVTPAAEDGVVAEPVLINGARIHRALQGFHHSIAVVFEAGQVRAVEVSTHEIGSCFVSLVHVFAKFGHQLCALFAWLEHIGQFRDQIRLQFSHCSLGHWTKHVQAQPELCFGLFQTAKVKQSLAVKLSSQGCGSVMGNVTGIDSGQCFPLATVVNQEDLCNFSPSGIGTTLSRNLVPTLGRLGISDQGVVHGNSPGWKYISWAEFVDHFEFPWPGKLSPGPLTS